MAKAPTKKVYKSADTGKIVSKKTADANPKETYAVEVELPQPEVVADTPPVGMYLDFQGADDSFIGVIQSIDPFVVVEHSLLNGCHSETERDDLNHADWVVRPMTIEEVFAALY
jgi:hypothetical protein